MSDTGGTVEWVCRWCCEPVEPHGGDCEWGHRTVSSTVMRFWCGDHRVMATQPLAGRADKTSTSDGATTRQLPQAVQPTLPGSQTGRKETQ